MDGWRHIPVAEADEPKFEPSPIKAKLDTETQPGRDEEEASVEPTPIIVKKEDLSDVPCKVPKFQYVDFPSLHQCIQQLAIPPLESWLARCPAGRPPSLDSRDSTERVPKFKYVDYPSLHHCIQQLSVPPLETWSLGLARSMSSNVIKPATGSLMPPVPSKEEQASQQAGHKWDRDTGLPGPSPGPIQTKPVSDTASFKPQHSVCVIGQTDARSPAALDRGQPCVETTNKGSDLERHFDHKLGPNSVASDRTTACLKARKRKQPHTNRMYMDLELDQVQPSVRAQLRDSPDSKPSSWRTVTEAVCPFCQKMFSDPEELRVHQRSHRDKKPH
ncbi:hypothetical protein AGOR_G00025860 [Albula goreensis]|uniref:C2H2-type domain-containing protein n=1 Tax=Albula goreensis TaxID=1534307 RepID=A0A8T3E6N5_9TELE|nr:hypothetical protein AGOR_G00025860 [Albula goreensis]